MNKLFISIILAFGLILSLGSCEKDDLNPEYPFIIQVKTFDDSVRVTNAFVEVFAPVRNSVPYFEGYTDENGKVNFKYDKDAIFMVRAFRGPIQDPSYIACSEVRLKANTTVTKIVYVKKVDPEIPGC